MASASHQLYTVVLLLTICHHGLGCKDEPVSDDIAGSTVRVEVLPESINELITDEISITCTPKDLPLGTKGILYMELGKKGEHRLVAMKGSTLELGTDIKNNMEWKGHNAKNASESFLQLTIQRPFVDDVSVYCCRVFYQDESDALKTGHAYANVSIENNDKAVFIHLLEKVSDLEKTVKEQEHQLMDQDTKVDELEEAGMNTSLRIQDIVDKGSFTSAFSVHGTKSSFSDGETLVFNKFLLNVGNHYNMATGVFTAPKKGLYVFHLFVWTYHNDTFRVHLKVNDVTMTSMYLYDNRYNEQGSVSTVLSLDTGDKVWPYVSTGGVLTTPNEHYTIFNGYLLKLL